MYTSCNSKIHSCFHFKLFIEKRQLVTPISSIIKKNCVKIFKVQLLERHKNKKTVNKARLIDKVFGKEYI